jgi:hypothetical protein
LRDRPSSLFRGSELPRLMFLAAIVLAGWPMIVLFARPQAPEAPPTPPSVPVEKITRIVPDTGVEFQAIQDRKPVEVRESAAYAILLQRARETPPKELASQARRDVFWSQLWDRPQAYRGVPIHLEGTAKKVLTHEVGPAMSPKGRLYEVWFYSDENRTFPYVVSIEDPPPGLVIGHELHLRVKVDAYFFKLLRYHAADVPRAAPMLVGRMQWIPALAEAPAPMVELRNWSRKDGFVILLGVLVAYMLLRAFFQVRKVLSPSSRPASFRIAEEALPPEEVSEWLRNLPDQVPESEEDVPPLRQGSHLQD